MKAFKGKEACKLIMTHQEWENIYLGRYLFLYST